MIPELNKLLNINKITGKPILVVYNSWDKTHHNYLINRFIPQNHSNHIYENTLNGKDLSSVLVGISGVSHGMSSLTETSLLTKLEDIPDLNLVWPGENWVKIS